MLFSEFVVFKVSVLPQPRLQEFYEGLLAIFWAEPPKGNRGPTTEELRTAEKDCKLMLPCQVVARSLWVCQEGLMQAFRIAASKKCELSDALAEAPLV